MSTLPLYYDQSHHIISFYVFIITILLLLSLYRHHHHDHQPGERIHLLVVPDVHSNRSVKEVLNHVSFQLQSILRIHPSFFHCSPKVTNNSKLQVSFGTRSKECWKSLWKLALNNNNHPHHHFISSPLSSLYPHHPHRYI